MLHPIGHITGQSAIAGVPEGNFLSYFQEYQCTNSLETRVRLSTMVNRTTRLIADCCSSSELYRISGCRHAPLCVTEHGSRGWHDNNQIWRRIFVQDDCHNQYFLRNDRIDPT